MDGVASNVEVNCRPVFVPVEYELNFENKVFIVSDKVAEDETMEEDVSFLVEDLVADDKRKLVKL